MPDERRATPEPRPGRGRRNGIIALVVIALFTPIAANIATPDAEPTRLTPDQIRELPHVDGYVKLASNDRIVVERSDGIFVNVDVGDGYLTSEDIAHLQDHARHGTPTRLRYLRRAGAKVGASVEDLDAFAGVERAAARELTEEELDSIDEGDRVETVVKRLGPPLEVRFDHTSRRDCWTWPIVQDDRRRAEVCFSTNSRARVVRVRTVAP